MNIQDELNKLNDKQRQELEKWFMEQIYKLNKDSRNEKTKLCTLCYKKTSCMGRF